MVRQAFQHTPSGCSVRIMVDDVLFEPRGERGERQRPVSWSDPRKYRRLWPLTLADARIRIRACHASPESSSRSSSPSSLGLPEHLAYFLTHLLKFKLWTYPWASMFPEIPCGSHGTGTSSKHWSPCLLRARLLHSAATSSRRWRAREKSLFFLILGTLGTLLKYSILAWSVRGCLSLASAPEQWGPLGCADKSWAALAKPGTPTGIKMATLALALARVI